MPSAALSWSDKSRALDDVSQPAKHETKAGVAMQRLFSPAVIDNTRLASFRYEHPLIITFGLRQQVKVHRRS
jgi:hypothetical protein